MNKKIKIIILLLIPLLLFTGCTKQLKDDKGKLVRSVETGQTLTSNILCQPEDKKIVKLYKKNKVNIDKLPKCSEMKVVSGKYEGIWTTIFVKPLSWLIYRFGNFIGGYGWAIIIATLIIRGILYPVTKKSAMQSENMKKAQPELQKLEKKYKNKTTQEDQMKKSQEMLLIYKKYNISVMSGCIFALIQIPLFFAFLESLNRLPAVFEGNFLLFKLGTSSGTAIAQGQIFYIILPILVAVTTYLSFKLNANASTTAEQEKMMKNMTNIMLVFITFMSFTMSTSIVIYWITNSIFTIIQNLVVRRNIENVKNNRTFSKN